MVASLLYLGSLFYRQGKKPAQKFKYLAGHVDQSLRQYATNSSLLATSGALDLLESCQPLIWVGITGQNVVGSNRFLVQRIF